MVTQTHRGALITGSDAPKLVRRQPLVKELTDRLLPPRQTCAANVRQLSATVPFSSHYHPPQKYALTPAVPAPAPAAAAVAALALRFLAPLSLSLGPRPLPTLLVLADKDRPPL
jgi:hypothetical protein